MSLSRIENGRRSLSLAMAAHVASVLGVGLGDLVQAPAVIAEPGEGAWLDLYRQARPEDRPRLLGMVKAFVRA